jgi:hypothetical protein
MLGLTERSSQESSMTVLEEKKPRKRMGGRMGGWLIAQSPILGTTITLSRLSRKGYIAMVDYYLKFKPVCPEAGLNFNEPCLATGRRRRSLSRHLSSGRSVAPMLKLRRKHMYWWCERRTSSLIAGEAVYSMCAVSYKGNVTRIKMEADLPARLIRRTCQTTSMMCHWERRRMKR